MQIHRAREAEPVQILMIAPAAYAHELSGVARYVEMLCDALHRHVGVTLIVPISTGPTRTAVPDLRIRTVEVQFALSRGWSQGLSAFCRGATEMLRAERARSAKRASLVVHVHGTTLGAAANRAVDLGFPTILTVHAFEGNHPTRSVARAIADEAIRAFGRVQELVSVSDHLGGRLARYRPPTMTVPTVTPGVRAGLIEHNLPRLGIDIDLLYVGRLEPDKRPHLAVEALAVVTKALGPRSMLVVGSGTQRGLIELKAAVLGVRRQIRFVATCTDRVLAQYYRRAAVVVVPSVSETFSLVALEAQTFGCRVVAFDSGGIREGKALQGLRLVAPGDVRSFFNAVVDELRHADGWTKERMEECNNGIRTGESMAADMLPLYRRAASMGRS